MDMITEIPAARPIASPSPNCFDATTFGRTVPLTAREEHRLRNVQAAFQYGFILRASIGAPFAEAALAAAERDGPNAEARPRGHAGMGLRTAPVQRRRAAQKGPQQSAARSSPLTPRRRGHRRAISGNERGTARAAQSAAKTQARHGGPRGA